MTDVMGVKTVPLGCHSAYHISRNFGYVARISAQCSLRTLQELYTEMYAKTMMNEGHVFKTNVTMAYTELSRMIVIPQA